MRPVLLSPNRLNRQLSKFQILSRTRVHRHSCTGVKFWLRALFVVCILSVATTRFLGAMRLWEWAQLAAWHRLFATRSFTSSTLSILGPKLPPQARTCQQSSWRKTSTGRKVSAASQRDSAPASTVRRAAALSISPFTSRSSSNWRPF